MESPNIMTGMN